MGIHVKIHNTHDDFPVMVTIPSSMLPDIKDWKVGTKYKFEVEAEQMSLEKPIFSSKKGLEARFKILKVKAL